MKKPLTISLLLSLALLLSACTKPNLSGREVKELSPSPTESVAAKPTVSEAPTPTLSKDSSLDSIEADLKATTVLEEDFSDIK
jgi:hypothetical protein